MSHNNKTQTMDLPEIETLLVRYFNNELSSAEAEKVAA